MTVKDKVGRRRYVVFRLSIGGTGNPRKDVEKLINQIRKDFKSVQLIQIKNGLGIIRVLHFEMNGVINALNVKYQNLSIETIATAGTIKKAREIIAKKWGNADLRN
ncbi:MAG: hypothetical protein QW620_01665 [Thermoplasmata archaeon]